MYLFIYLFFPVEIRRGNTSGSKFGQQWLIEHNPEFKILHKWSDANPINPNFQVLNIV